MFIEFNQNELEKLRSLSETEKEEAIQIDEVQVAVDISIKVESKQRLLSEHKFYQVFTYGKLHLIDGLIVTKITAKETTIKIPTFIHNHNDEYQTLLIKTDEEKTIQIGNKPYEIVYKIAITNPKYGKTVEL